MSGRPASPHTLAGTEEPVVFVVDDDASMRDALRNLFNADGGVPEDGLRLVIDQARRNAKIASPDYSWLSE